ncbi:MAG: hypothetical protein ABIQ95_01230 [Bdellovibrionia bacterium]
MAIKKLDRLCSLRGFSYLALGGILILSASLASAAGNSRAKGVTFAEEIASIFEFEAEIEGLDEVEEGTDPKILRQEQNARVLKDAKAEAVRDPEFHELIRNIPQGMYAKNQRKIYAVRANIRQDSEIAEVQFYQEQGSTDLRIKKLFHTTELAKANQAFATAGSAIARLHSLGTASQSELDAANQYYFYCKELKTFHRDELATVSMALVTIDGQI